MPDLIIKENEKTVRQDIITNTKGYNTSEKYIPIATQEVIDVISKAVGYTPEIVGFNNANVRKQEKEGFQKNAVMLKMKNADMGNGNSMRLSIFNSNDRSSSLKIYLSYHRAVCSNGMILSGEQAEPVSIRHTTKGWEYTIMGMMSEFAEKQKFFEKQIEDMMATEVSYQDIGLMVAQVTEKILDPSITGSILDPMELNVAHRKEDVGNNVFLMQQRIQYNLMHGNFQRVIEKTDDDGVLFDHISRGHKVTNIDKEVKLNRTLHDFTVELLKSKTTIEEEILDTV